MWNSNATVQTAGADLVKKMAKLLSEPGYPDLPAGSAVAAFSSRLGNAVVAPEPSNAARGTSDHGRGTAVDFVVMKGGTIAANTFTAQIPTQWKKAGWEAKRIAACKGTKLKGPLKVPSAVRCLLDDELLTGALRVNADPAFVAQKALPRWAKRWRKEVSAADTLISTEFGDNGISYFFVVAADERGVRGVYRRAEFWPN